MMTGDSWLHLPLDMLAESREFAKDLLELYLAIRFDEPLTDKTISKLSKHRPLKEQSFNQLSSDHIAIKTEITEELQRRAQQRAIQEKLGDVNQNSVNRGQSC